MHGNSPLQNAKFVAKLHNMSSFYTRNATSIFDRKINVKATQQ